MKAPVAIVQGAGQAINLGLGEDFGRRVEIEEAHDAGQKITHLLLAEGVGE